MTDHYIDVNRAHWDEVVAIHVASKMYDIDGFKAGTRGLHQIELDELGDVSGKTLLHLQCHFGMDTLSWARLGATVTGIDFSERAIEQARALSDEIGVPARFIQSDLYDLPSALDETFDIVFTSYGVLGWLPDLERWGEIVARFLKPGGSFYIAEFHPVGFLFDYLAEDGFRLKYPYFKGGAPIHDAGPDYADPEAAVEHADTYGWPYELGEVVNVLVDNGLRIEFLHEFPYSTFRQFPFLVPRDGFWHVPDGMEPLPLVFSIRARKE